MEEEGYVNNASYKNGVFHLLTFSLVPIVHQSGENFPSMIKEYPAEFAQQTCNLSVFMRALLVAVSCENAHDHSIFEFCLGRRMIGHDIPVEYCIVGSW